MQGLTVSPTKEDHKGPSTSDTPTREDRCGRWEQDRETDGAAPAADHMPLGSLGLKEKHKQKPGQHRALTRPTGSLACPELRSKPLGQRLRGPESGRG